MDTVEWGSVEPAQRAPNRVSTGYVGALVVAVTGFALLIAAELNPWAVAQSAGANGLSTSHVSGGLEIESAAGIAYLFGVLALLGAAGLTLGSPAGRRRGPLGLAAGLAAGQLLVVVEVLRVLQRGLEGTGPGQAPGVDTVVTGAQVSYASGVYMAVAGVLAVVAAAMLSTVRWRDLAARAPVVAVEPAAREGDRELTVTALEPLDEAHFARE